MAVSARTLQRYRSELRRTQTRYEKALAAKLDAAGLEYKPQMILGFYIVDFALPRKMIVLECDGSHHSKAHQRAMDELRTRFIQDSGFAVWRVDNTCVKTYNVSDLLREPDFPLSRFRSALGKANAMKSTFRARRMKERHG